MVAISRLRSVNDDKVTHIIDHTMLHVGHLFAIMGGSGFLNISNCVPEEVCAWFRSCARRDFHTANVVSRLMANKVYPGPDIRHVSCQEILS